MTKGRLLTGDRPTGRLHVGHYVGTLENRVRLQDEYECFFLVADLHMLTTAYDHMPEVGENVRGLVLDYLGVGIDPQKCTIYAQSGVPEVVELFLLFSMLVSVPRLQRVPTLKDMIRDLQLETASLGLLSYPVLQAADILMVRASLVPVGKDQASHLEVVREIARRFNALYGETFPEPDTLIGRVPTLVGLDGKAKMSKSLGNAIYLCDSADEVKKKVSGMFTDPTKIRKTDPGHPETCPVYAYHRTFNSGSRDNDEIRSACKKGQLGCVECKGRLTKVMNAFLDPIRERQAPYEARPQLIEEIIVSGTEVARAGAKETLRLAKDAMGLNYLSARGG